MVRYASELWKNTKHEIQYATAANEFKKNEKGPTCSTLEKKVSEHLIGYNYYFWNGPEESFEECTMKKLLKNKPVGARNVSNGGGNLQRTTNRQSKFRFHCSF